MQIDGNKPVTPTLGQKIAKPFIKTKEAVKKAIDAVDRYTSPREDTAGEFKEASYFQACFTGATEGFYTLGLPGTVVGAVPAAVGVAVTRKTNKTFLGVLAGVASGMAVGAGMGALTGNPAGVVGCTIAGGVLGAMETFRGDPNSKTRDGGGNANMVSAFWVPGPGKMAAGIGSAAGTKMKSKAGKAAVGAAVAGTIGGVLAAVGFSPVTIPVAVAACAVGGAVGPFLGPRFSQFFRNLSSDIGKGIDKAGKKMGFFKNETDKGKRTKSAVGAIPSSFVKEGLRALAMSDGDPVKMVVGGVMESIEQAHIFITQKIDEGKEADKAEITAKTSEAKANTEGQIADKLAANKVNNDQ